MYLLSKQSTLPHGTSRILWYLSQVPKKQPLGASVDDYGVHVRVLHAVKHGSETVKYSISSWGLVLLENCEITLGIH